MRRKFPQNLVGLTFDHLTVIRLEGKQSGHTVWLCRCSCGIVKPVIRCSLTTGHSRSCGHRIAEIGRSRGDGRKRTILYRTWQMMKDRCLNANSRAYAHYGGRGITVCERWLTFDNFRNDMGKRPSPQHSIERVNNNGPYSPENCKWATRDEQNANKRSSRYVVFRGEKRTVAQWATIGVVSTATFRQRLAKGWNIERALFSPPKPGVRQC